MTKLWLLLALFLQVNIANTPGTSLVYWKGTKLHGTGSHEGVLKFKTLALNTKNGEITGGRIVIDMRSLEVTDIPAHEIIPLNALTKHLHEELEIAKYPTATFVITKVKDHILSGSMTIRNIAKVISLPYQTTNSSYQATFSFSRKAFGIGANAGWLEKKLVDDAIELRIVIGKAQ